MTLELVEQESVIRDLEPQEMLEAIFEEITNNLPTTIRLLTAHPTSHWNIYAEDTRPRIQIFHKKPRIIIYEQTYRPLARRIQQTFTNQGLEYPLEQR